MYSRYLFYVRYSIRFNFWLHLGLDNAIMIIIVNRLKCRRLSNKNKSRYLVGVVVSDLSTDSFMTAWAPLQICRTYFVLTSETIPI